jgi:threonine synthase
MISWHLTCAACATPYPGLDPRNRCDCGGTLDVIHTGASRPGRAAFDARLIEKDALNRSGVWRYRERIIPLAPEHIVTRHEGNTGHYQSPRVAQYVGLEHLSLKHEGENPTGSFKDRGMTAGISMAKRLGMTRVACASTGNTSASMAAYAATCDLQAYVFIPAGRIAYGKLSQALAYGAQTLQIDGDFDEAMQLVERLCTAEGIYLLNSVNPWRIEGQKAIGFEILQDRDWRVPDWIVLPGGNLGNSTALAKGLMELYTDGVIDRLPRIAIVQAAGANPLYTLWSSGQWQTATGIQAVKAETLATAIRIGDPISWRKCLRGVQQTNGVITEVSDQAIMDAKAHVDRAGIGAEPASCATVAGIKRLVAEGVIAPTDDVVGILTGHLLKDPTTVVDYHRGTLDNIHSHWANAPTPVAPTLDAVRRALDL